MIKLYKVMILFTLSEEDKTVVVNASDDFENLDEVPEIDYEFHVGAKDFLDATMTAHACAEEIYPNGFEILSIEEMPEIHIWNWKEDVNPFDVTEETPLDNVLFFTCTCGEELKVLKDGWEYTTCPECDKVIDKNRIIETKGKAFLIDNED